MSTLSVTACLIIIGNEILSGRTQDKNLAWLAAQLNETGVQLKEVRVIPDVEETIIETVNHCRARFDYLFTTGGIGPTHDDITSASIAKAFGRSLIRHKDAEAVLLHHYGDQLNEARLKMADVPEGAVLIPNPVSAAPGFRVENVYVMAGVPRIMQAMFEHLKPELKGGAPVRSRSFSLFVTEGVIAKGLAAVQHRHADVEIGSYPFIRHGKLGTSLVLRSAEEDKLNKAAEELRRFLETTGETVMEDG